MDEFRRLLVVIMADDVADYLSNAVLMACTRPSGGIISVSLHPSDAAVLADVVDRAAAAGSGYLDLANLIRAQHQAASLPP